MTSDSRYAFLYEAKYSMGMVSNLPGGDERRFPLGAARMLAITQPTAGRHIAALESALGLVLFTRSQTGLQPTDAAVALQGHAQAMENTASMIERSAASFSAHSAGLHGVVRVSASEIIGTEVLPPLFAGIKEDYPQLTLELVISNRMQDLLNREADIAVRMSTPVQEQLIARRLGSIEIGLHASPSYLARHGMPESIDALFTHTLVGFDKTTPFILQALKHFPQLNRERFTVRTDSDVAQPYPRRCGYRNVSGSTGRFPCSVRASDAWFLCLSSRHLAGYA
jgi:DNA-binding transcriptional LysR family regulator